MRMPISNGIDEAAARLGRESLHCPSFCQTDFIYTYPRYRAGLFEIYRPTTDQKPSFVTRS